jgi:selenocysteine lyase/cysteine desulfurase
MLDSKKTHFSLPENVHYLNCATMSPSAKAVEKAGIEGLLRKSQPYRITQDDFFSTAETVKKQFAELINCPDHTRIALSSSVSYSMAIVVKNLLKKRNITPHHKVIIVGDEFPSDVYAWEELVRERGVRIESITAPKTLENRGQIWNQKLLDAIDESTVLLCLSPTHWTDGTRFDLETISQKCKVNNVFFAIDGTQHIGAHSFDSQIVKPDFLVTASYKWLLGPYSTALMYLSDFFDDGWPLEQTWVGRKNSNDFKNLINYQSEYRPNAYRYDMGEYGNFTNLPMTSAALGLLLEWQPKRIQTYAQTLAQPYLNKLTEAGYWIENEEFRASHLLGIKTPAHIDLLKIQQSLLAQNIYVSYRGDAIRLSVNVWNEDADLEAFTNVLLNQ